jgi:hypothetical protein
MKIRYYILVNDRLYRATKAFLEKRVPISIPAGRYPFLECLFDLNGSTITVVHMTGHYYEVGGDGYLGWVLGGMVDSLNYTAALDRARRQNLPSLPHLASLKAEYDKHRWSPTNEQYDQVMNDISPSWAQGHRPIPIVRKSAA